MRKIVNFSDIDRNTPEGRVLAAAIMMVSTTPGHTHKSPDQILDSINELADEMHSHSENITFTAQEKRNELTASEALFGFSAWLSTRQEKTVFSSSSNCAPIAELIKDFLNSNQLSEPRKGWENLLVHPKAKAIVRPVAIPHPTLGPTGHGDECMSDADNGL